MRCKVSIIIRVYNCEETIKRAMDSALSQNFPKENFEVLVVDDGSTDNTPKILEGYKKRENLRVITQKNQGYVKAANVGFLNAKGEYVVLLDDDDYFDENIISELSQILDYEPKISFAYSDYFEVSDMREKLLISPKNIFEIVAGGVLFRKSDLEKEEFLREDLVFPEYDLLLRTLGIWKSHYHAKPLFFYTRRRGSVTANKSAVDKGIAELKKLHPDKMEFISKIRKYGPHT